MSELPDEVRAAIHKKTMSQPLVEGVLRYLHDRHLILFASELRDEAVIERAEAAYLTHEIVVNGDALRAALSAVVEGSERRAKHPPGACGGLAAGCVFCLVREESE